MFIDFQAPSHGRNKKRSKRLILYLTHWVEASAAAFWPSKPHEHWCFRHHKGNGFNFKKEIRVEGHAEFPPKWFVGWR
jgi:hypothetical protein